MKTTIVLEISHKKPLPLLPDLVSQRAYSIEGVDNVTVVSTDSRWSPGFSNPFAAIEFVTKARDTPGDFQRALGVMRESAGWDTIDPKEFVDDLLQEIAGVTNIVVQFDTDGTWRAAYDD